MASYSSSTGSAWSLVDPNPTVTGYLNKYQDTVFFNLDSKYATSTSSNPIAFANPIPEGYRPLTQQDIAVPTVNGTTWQMGIVRISTSGVVTVYMTLATGNFSSGVTTGFNICSAIWKTG